MLVDESQSQLPVVVVHCHLVGLGADDQRRVGVGERLLLGWRRRHLVGIERLLLLRLLGEVEHVHLLLRMLLMILHLRMEGRRLEEN